MTLSNLSLQKWGPRFAFVRSRCIRMGEMKRFQRNLDNYSGHRRQNPVDVVTLVIMEKSPVFKCSQEEGFVSLLRIKNISSYGFSDVNRYFKAGMNHLGIKPEYRRKRLVPFWSNENLESGNSFLESERLECILLKIRGVFSMDGGNFLDSIDAKDHYGEEISEGEKWSPLGHYKLHQLRLEAWIICRARKVSASSKSENHYPERSG
ncbi:hypothetical protein Tco_1111931 [Tanacetum coccineum]|uniref:Uncharacterized protein n=1 Tax=Tanacetum coccineum TaxID=301880 RepID=A0ABQ5IQU6_9ASTR